MRATNMILEAKRRRGLRYTDLSEKIGGNASATVIANNLTRKDDLNTKQFLMYANALKYKIFMIPEERLKDYDTNDWIIMNEDQLNLIRIRTKRNCPFCGHKITPREREYKGCPYCFHEWEYLKDDGRFREEMEAIENTESMINEEDIDLDSLLDTEENE